MTSANWATGAEFGGESGIRTLIIQGHIIWCTRVDSNHHSLIGIAGVLQTLGLSSAQLVRTIIENLADVIGVEPITF